MDEIKLIKKLLDLDNDNEGTFLEVGEKYLFRTVTMIYTGRIKRMKGQEILLEDAAWIADTGRWADNLKSCEFNEVEPYFRDVVIFRGALLDVTKIDTLPREQK